jgi:hypothetical protein
MLTEPESNSSRPLRQRKNVDLPDPDGPITTSTSPLATVGADVIHRAHHLPAGVEDFYQIADFNHFARASAQDGWPFWTAAG